MLKCYYLNLKKIKLGSETSDCIFIRYVEYSVVYRFLVLKSDVLDCHIIRETKNAKFFEHISPLSNKLFHAPVEINREITSNEELRRSKRLRKEFSYGNDVQTFLIDNDPLIYSDTICSPNCKFWKEAIKSKVYYFMKNKTWT